MKTKKIIVLLKYWTNTNNLDTLIDLSKERPKVYLH